MSHSSGNWEVQDQGVSQFFFFFFGKSSLPGLQMVTFSVYVHGETESKQTLQGLFL